MNPFKKKQTGANPQSFESTQKYLAIDQIKDDVLLMKDGSLRGVLMVSSINMSLRSEQEQSSIIYAYQNALNSLDFPVQILVQSRKVDLTSYMAILEKEYEKEAPGLLKDQIQEYISFLQQILESVNVMDKRFFVTVPYFPNVIQESSKGVLSIVGLGKKANPVSQSQRNYSINLDQLNQRLDIVTSLLSTIELKASRLPTEALIELFYVCYNPETAGHEHIKNLDSFGAKYITRRESLGGNTIGGGYAG